MIGAGLGGLCCAALLAKYGVQVHPARAAMRLVRLEGKTRKARARAHSLKYQTCRTAWGWASMHYFSDFNTHDAGALPAPGFEHMEAVMQVTVVESHAIPGGAAHAWVQNGYHFESGPSLYSGMAAKWGPLLVLYAHCST